MPEVIKVVDVEGDDLKALEFKPEGLEGENEQLTKLLKERKTQIQTTLNRFMDRNKEEYTSFISDNEEAFNQALIDYTGQLNQIIEDFGSTLKRIAENENLTIREELIKMDPGYELIKAIRKHFNNNISDILDAAEEGGVAAVAQAEEAADEDTEDGSKLLYEDDVKSVIGTTARGVRALKGELRDEQIKKAIKG